MNRFLLLLLLVLPSCLLSQKMEVENIVKSESQVTTFEEYLVYLAWLNHPTSDMLESQMNIASTNIQSKKAGVWDAFNPFFSYSTGNINGITTAVINPLPGENPTSSNDGTTNGFAAGISFRIAPLITTKNEVKMAEEQLKIASANYNAGKLQIRAKVLALYSQFQLQQQIVEERLKIEEERKENQRLILELFKREGAEYEDVTIASAEYHKATEERILAEMDVKLTKVSLEELTGITLEEALILFSER